MNQTKRISLFILVLNLLIGVHLSAELFQFDHYSTLIPHPEKANHGGQDAYFASSEIFIVADGVGGWNSLGIDPSKYSRYLCSKGSQLFYSDPQFYRKNAIQIIAQSSKTNQNLGSSTMAVVLLDNQYLRTCYIGDSGFIIFRLNLDKEQYELFFQFEEQQHSFNLPFQLAKDQDHGDNPYLSICRDFMMQENDIVLVGSDGLFDNIFTDQILSVINQEFKNNQNFKSITQILAEWAIRRGKNTRFQSPFAKKARSHNISYRGGKLDDTTVVLGRIKRKQNPIQNNTQEKLLVNKAGQKQSKMNTNGDVKEIFEKRNEDNDSQI